MHIIICNYNSFTCFSAVLGREWGGGRRAGRGGEERRAAGRIPTGCIASSTARCGDTPGQRRPGLQNTQTRSALRRELPRAIQTRFALRREPPRAIQTRFAMLPTPLPKIPDPRGKLQTSLPLLGGPKTIYSQKYSPTVKFTPGPRAQKCVLPKLLPRLLIYSRRSGKFTPGIPPGKIYSRKVLPRLLNLLPESPLAKFTPEKYSRDCKFTPGLRPQNWLLPKVLPRLLNLQTRFTTARRAPKNLLPKVLPPEKITHQMSPGRWAQKPDTPKLTPATSCRKLDTPKVTPAPRATALNTHKITPACTWRLAQKTDAPKFTPAPPAVRRRSPPPQPPIHSGTKTPDSRSPGDCRGRGRMASVFLCVPLPRIDTVSWVGGGGGRKGGNSLAWRLHTSPLPFFLLVFTRTFPSSSFPTTPSGLFPILPLPICKTRTIFQINHRRVRPQSHECLSPCLFIYSFIMSCL